MTKSKKIFIGIVIIAVIIIAAVAVTRTGKFGNFFIAGNNTSSSTSGYQAVFLTNGQVYFGRLSGSTSQFPTLRDIYYLQVQNKGGEPVGPGDVSLVKLGNELHGPTDEMRINRDHIILTENLKSDSNVVSAIKKFEEKKTK